MGAFAMVGLFSTAPLSSTPRLSCSPQQLIWQALAGHPPLSWTDALALLDCALDALHELTLPDC